jgi:cytosine/adenosine deaminase-related metal-dependent hydrolase
MLPRPCLAPVIALALSAVACGQPATPSPTTSSASSADASVSSAASSGTAGSSTAGSGGAGGSGGTSSAGGAGGTSTTSTTGSTGGAMGTGGSVPCGTGTGGGGSGGAATIVSVGTPGQLLLRGMVVTPDQAFQGEVLIAGDTITCAAASCAGMPGAATATVVDTHGIIFPGLIDTHNHILFDIFDETDWSPLMSYGNHKQWTNEARYGALVDAKQYLNGEASSPVDFGCELDKYGEIKGLVAGTTSIVGAANPANRACYGSLSRTVDQTPNGLGTDKIQVATLFPSGTAADGVCTNFTSGKTDAYVIHVAEGVDATALKEFSTLGTVTTTDGCLYAPKTAVVHGTALGDAELSIMGQDGMSLVWSPRSNVFLYGGGTDLTRTANVPLALSKGINVALAPDWSIGGSQNLLDELRFADQVDNTVWGDKITPKLLTQMVTINAAKALGLEALIGSLEAGKKADVMVIGGDACAPYDALLAATPADVRLVLVGGVALYGDAALKPLGPATPGCEDLDVCAGSKFICVATPSSTATDKLGQTLAQIQSTLDTALSDYDALALTAWTFAPITPIVRCP